MARKMTRLLRVALIVLTLGALGASTGCTLQQGQHAAATTNAVVKAARAVCGWIMRLPDAPIPVPGGDAGASSGGALMPPLPPVPNADLAPSPQ